MSRKNLLWPAAVCWILWTAPAWGDKNLSSPGLSFRLSAEIPLGQFGGVPYCVDLDQNGEGEILWLQSAGMFSSRVYDGTSWEKRISAAERELFCLTATDARGRILWRLGRPWSGDAPFLSHGNERTLACADLDGDGTVEIVCTRGNEILIIDGKRGTIQRSVVAPSDNIRTVCLGRTGPGPADWTILAKNQERSYEPNEYANPTCFYDADLNLLKVVDYPGAGHVPLAADVDGDGRDEFAVGYCLIDDNLETKWEFQPVPAEQWNAEEMHVDDHSLGVVGSRLCFLLAASDMTYLLDAQDGTLIWKRKGEHPQHGQIGQFDPASAGQEALIYNKRGDFQLYDASGNELWRMTPPVNFPLGQAAPCRRQKFHVFDPTTVLKGMGPAGTDLLIFTDGGWPYVIDGFGRRCLEFPYTLNAAQDWGEVPGRPDDYGYGYYARVADFNSDQKPEIMISDRRFAWFYEIETFSLEGDDPPTGAGRLSRTGEVLYNGIRLPLDWPPDLEASDLESRRVPYLESPPPIIPIDVGRQLFVDDFLIDRTTLQRTYHPVEPYAGNPILEADRPWEQEGQWQGQRGPYAIPFSDGVWYDPADSLFKMWYMGGLLYSTCYATSEDGICWIKPELDVMPGTNIVHSGNRDSCTIWLDLDEKDPGHRYKMLRFQKSPRRGLVLHYSGDGIHWSDEITWAGRCHDRTTVFYNPFRRRWVCSIKATLPPEPPYHRRVRRYHEGTDLESALRWNDYGDPRLWLTDVRPDPVDPHVLAEAAIYNLDVVAYESVLLGLFTILERDADKEGGRPKRNQVFAGFSRDGFHWHRPYVEPLFGVSECRGDWNWGNVQSVGGCCLIIGDKLYFYYSGRAGTGRMGKDRSYYDSDARTGLGFLRRDGFASMAAGGSGGELMTRPLRFNGRYLFVNADTAGGELRVEALDRDGRVIVPFSLEASIPIRSNQTLARVRWKAADDLGALAGQPVRFRFWLREGSLYSFWVSPDVSGASYGYVAAGGPGFTGSTDTVGAGVPVRSQIQGGSEDEANR